MTHQALRILLVEDNPGDVDLVIESLRSTRLRRTIDVAQDGEKAMKYLLDRASQPIMDGPDLIILDLNLPRKDGREVLAEVKSHPRLMHIPIVVLTSSEAEGDLLQAYQLHANSFITKPVDLESYMRVAQAIETYWCCIVKLPPTLSRDPIQGKINASALMPTSSV